MPPERLRVPRAAPDPSADVYSFGKQMQLGLILKAILFWQMLTRREPFLSYQERNEIDPFKRAIIEVTGERMRLTLPEP